jgi:hypothetical protein
MYINTFRILNKKRKRKKHIIYIYKTGFFLEIGHKLTSLTALINYQIITYMYINFEVAQSVGTTLNEVIVTSSNPPSLSCADMSKKKKKTLR